MAIQTISPATNQVVCSFEEMTGPRVSTLTDPF
jgi:hypothetical protein